MQIDLERGEARAILLESGRRPLFSSKCECSVSECAQVRLRERPMGSGNGLGDAAQKARRASNHRPRAPRRLRQLMRAPRAHKDGSRSSFCPVQRRGQQYVSEERRESFPHAERSGRRGARSVRDYNYCTVEEWQVESDDKRQGICSQCRLERRGELRSPAQVQVGLSSVEAASNGNCRLPSG